MREATPTETGVVHFSSIRDTDRTVLEFQGFIQLTPEFFTQREPAAPETCWRVGLDLTEVHSGYAIDREYEHEGERRNLTNDLLAGLRDGIDHAVIGPPGSGKSTVCKAVACRWYERGWGQVFYRESGTGPSFTAKAVLSAQLRRAEGQAIVVVEDAVREEANAIFRLIKAFSGNLNVAFLLDSRTKEWQDPETFPISASLDDYRTEAIETIDIPGLDEQECERFIHHFEESVGHPVGASPAHLLEKLRAESETDTAEEAVPHGLLILLHQLTAYTDPLAGTESRTPTTLVEDVQRAYADLRDTNELAVDVGILVNLLNAADIGVHPELVYALGADGEYKEIGVALDTLDRRVIFNHDEPREDGTLRIDQSTSRGPRCFWRTFSMPNRNTMLTDGSVDVSRHSCR